MKSPFKFLDPYQLEDRDAFFGREAETKELYNLVTKNRLTFVYGPSGTGKTSLLRCGLANRFGGVDWLPLFIRRGDDINQSLRAAIGAALGEGPGFTGDLAEAVGALFSRYLRPVYLIFDQFEELFILGKNDPEEKERQPFYDTVAELLAADLPCRLLFILREDYFGHLNQFEKTVPELYHRKLRVEPMHRDNLRAVIAGSCRVHHIPFGDERRDPDRILDNILADKAGAHMPYVQVYLHMLYQEALRQQHPRLQPAAAEAPPVRFDAAVIDGVGRIEGVLGRFLEEQSLDLLQRLKKQGLHPADDLVRRVLDPFVSEEGTKAPVRYATRADGTPALQGTAAARLSKQDPALVSACLRELEAARILRRSETDYELAHDTLAAIVAGRRDAALQQERDAYNSIEAAYREHAEAQKKGEDAYFDRKRLNRLEPFLEHLELKPEWTAFLAASRAEAERLEKAELERAERELRLAGEKLAAEQKARERQRFFTRVVAAVAVLAVLLGVFAWMSYRDANRRRLEADAAKTAAQRSDSIAQKEKTKALLAADTALLATLAALRSDSLSKREKNRADQALLEAQGNAQIAVRTLLTVAGKAVKQLNYPEASEAVNAAVRLEADKPAVADALLEMAFYHNHTGDRKTAAQETAAAARWLNRPDLAAQAERLAADTRPLALRAVQKALAPARFQELDEQYFPKMIPVKGGTFTPGCVKPDDGLCREYNKDGLYRATISNFELAETETTILQYHLYTTALGRRIGQRITPADTLKEYDTPTWGWPYDHPVIYVNWYDAVEYANWASEQQGLKPVYDIVKTERDTANKNSNDEYGWLVRIREGADGYRLPTEAEWEFAARGGAKQDTFRYAGSDVLDEVAWHGHNSGSRTHAVGGKRPNTLQLYDLSGNVWEWCWDWDGDYPKQAETNYQGGPSGIYRVLRGGSWIDIYDDNCRPANRFYNYPVSRYLSDGFRVARH